MATISPEIFQEVLSAYAWGEGTLSYNSYGEGHINNTYLVTVKGKIRDQIYPATDQHGHFYRSETTDGKHLWRYFLSERSDQQTRR